MFELGVAIAAKGTSSGRVFIFAKKDQKEKDALSRIPSDLRGYFITFYDVKGDKQKLIDQRGFTAALKAIIMEDAHARGMLVYPSPKTEDAAD